MFGRLRPGRRTAAGLAAAALCATSVATTVAAPAHAAEALAGGDFYTSFEDSGPQLTWSNTVETDAAGNRLTANVVGPSGSGYPGSVNETINEVTASGENAPGEVKENVADGDPDSKWLVFPADRLARDGCSTASPRPPRS